MMSWLTFAIGLGDHRFDFGVQWITAEISQSVAQFSRLDALAGVVDELGEQNLVLCAHEVHTLSLSR